MRAIAPTVLVGLLAAGCSGSVPVPVPAPSTSGTTTSEPESVEPSITRQVPPDRRTPLARASAQQLCGLVTPDELGRLAGFPVQPGVPNEVEPSIRGCRYAAADTRSILVAAQPDGYGSLGKEEVELGPVRGTQSLHANDCTVYAPVAGSTLQVAVNAAEADSDECDSAQGIAQYVLAGLR